MRYRTLLCASILSVLACSSDARPPDDASTTTIRFVVDTVPLLDITGTVTPDSSAFLLAAAGLRLDDGRIVIADMYDAAVRYFDASGLGDPVTRLRAIAADGSIVGDVELPINLDVFDVGHDYVLGAYVDGDGEQHVVLYGMGQDSSVSR